MYFIFYFFTFVGSAWSFRFFIPATTANDLRLWKDFYTRSYPLRYFLILILEKKPVFPFTMLSAKQGNYWYHFYNVFGLTRSLTGDWTRDLPHSKPALYNYMFILKLSQLTLTKIVEISRKKSSCYNKLTTTTGPDFIIISLA